MRKSFVKYKVRQYCENCSSLSKRKIHPKQDPSLSTEHAHPHLTQTTLLPVCLALPVFLSKFYHYSAPKSIST